MLKLMMTTAQSNFYSLCVSFFLLFPGNFRFRDYAGKFCCNLICFVFPLISLHHTSALCSCHCFSILRVNISILSTDEGLIRILWQNKPVFLCVCCNMLNVCMCVPCFCFFYSPPPLRISHYIQYI